MLRKLVTSLKITTLRDFFVLFFTSLFVLLGTKWCFSFTFLILLVSVSELQSCCAGETVPRKPCGTQTTHIKTASTLHINVCHHNQTQLSLREHKDSPPQLAQGAKVDYDAKVSITSQAKSSNRPAFKHCQLLIRN